MSLSGPVTHFRLDWRLFNPLLYHLLRFMLDPNIRRITNFGGSSSGKTYSIAQAVLILTEYDGENTIVFRKVGASISKTIWEDFKVAARQLGMFDRLVFRESVRRIQFPNGAKIDFSGLDDPEKIKGISNYKRVVKDELSEFEKEDDDQIRKRLRGKEGQQIIDAFNPISENHWIKKEYFDKEEWHDIPMRVEIDGKKIPAKLTKLKALKMNAPKIIPNPQTGEMEEHPSDTVITQTTYLNNFWVVGSPDGSFGFYDRQCVADFEKDRVNNPQFYNVYALGEWGIILTGSEYFGSFNRGIHCKRVEYDPTLPIHISVDNNVLPYITITFWQIDLNEGKHIRQIGEICAAPPDNSVQRAAKLVSQKLKILDPPAVFLHGDATTKAANTIDEQKRSWLDLFIDRLSKSGIEVTDCVGNRNPSVMLSGEFINSILSFSVEGIDILINEECTVSIDDYMRTQKDVNGGMEKRRVKNKITGQTYEELGHCSDTCRYVVCDLLREEFIQFSNQRKRNIYAGDGFLQYFNPKTKCDYSGNIMYLLPDVEGRSVWLHAFRCADHWHVKKAAISEIVMNADEIRSLCTSLSPSLLILECAPAYYPLVRGLREVIDEVRAIKIGEDIEKRINATSSLVKDIVLFDPEREENDREYREFVTSLLDYRKESDSVQASACLSGFVNFVSRRKRSEE